MINEREEINETNSGIEDQECDHIWELNECDGGTHFYFCRNCGEEDEGDCDCEDLEDEDDRPEIPY